MAVSTQYRTKRYTTYGNVAYQPEPEPIRRGAQRPGQEAERVRRQIGRASCRERV